MKEFIKGLKKELPVALAMGWFIAVPFIIIPHVLGVILTSAGITARSECYPYLAIAWIIWGLGTFIGFLCMK